MARGREDILHLTSLGVVGAQAQCKRPAAAGEPLLSRAVDIHRPPCRNSPPRDRRRLAGTAGWAAVSAPRWGRASCLLPPPPPTQRILCQWPPCHAFLSQVVKRQK